MIINTIEELNQQPEYKKALLELVYQLADDDFFVSYRGAEWLGLCPHIEEDVAYSSINQNTMGHAAMYYELLEAIGEGESNKLAHLRSANERKNAILLEEVNGPGTYLVEPEYDWAFAVVRNYFYDTAKRIRLNSLRNSSYVPLANCARKVSGEQHYHVMHWSVWFKQLLSSTDEAKRRMTEQIERCWKDMGGVLSLGPVGNQMAEFGLIDSEETLTSQWLEEMKAVFNELGMSLPSEKPGMEQGDGRAGIHTEQLASAVEILSEVLKLDTEAAW